MLGPDLVVTHMGADAVEIAPAGADKGVGLDWLCRHLGIDAATIRAAAQASFQTGRATTQPNMLRVQ